MAGFLIPAGAALARWGIPAAIGAGSTFLDGESSPSEFAGGAVGGLIGGGGARWATGKAFGMLPKTPFLNWLGVTSRQVAPSIGAYAQGRLANHSSGTPTPDGGPDPIPDPGYWSTAMGMLDGLRMPTKEEDNSGGFNDFWKAIHGRYNSTPFEGKDLMGWMQDQRTQGIVNDTIRAENKPIRELIKEEKKQLATDLHNIQVLDEEYGRSVEAKTAALRHEAMKSNKRYAEHVREIQDDADEALDNILSMYNSTDDRSQRREVEQAAERRVPDEQHQDGITSLATEHLAEIAAIESAQSHQDMRDREAESRSTIRQARSQISSNWGKKRGLIAELASQLADDDLQRYQIRAQDNQGRNNFLGVALHEYPGYGGGSSLSEYDKYYQRYAAKAAANEMFGIPVEITSLPGESGTTKQFLTQNQFARAQGVDGNQGGGNLFGFVG